jgi:hypothetical protein
VQRVAGESEETRDEYEKDVRDYKLYVGLREGKRESALISTCQPLNPRSSSLVDARQHDKAIHEQQPKATPAHPEYQQSNPCLPAPPRPEEEGSRTALLPEASEDMASSPYVLADQWPCKARRPILVLLVLALYSAAYAWVRAVAATPNID